MIDQLLQGNRRVRRRGLELRAIHQALSLGTVDLIYTGQSFAARTLPALSVGGAWFRRTMSILVRLTGAPVQVAAVAEDRPVTRV